MFDLFSDALYDAASLAFEDLAFMRVSGLAGRWRKNCRPVSVQVSFSGPFSGSLYITLDGPILPTLAANMLGEIVAPAMDLQCDALGEFANVVCGNLLPKIAGSEAVFDVDVPLLVDNMSKYFLAEPAAEIRISVEGGLADLRLLLINELSAAETTLPTCRS